eukprot:6460950-Amphidinium_carterae.1
MDCINMTAVLATFDPDNNQQRSTINITWLPLILNYGMTTWDGLTLIPKFWNENSGWAATDPPKWVSFYMWDVGFSGQ